MKHLSKKGIKAAIELRKHKSTGPAGFQPPAGKLASKKTSLRIRKQGV